MDTKHNGTCKMAFGKPSKHELCPRCNELKNGAEARTWSTKRTFEKRAAAFRTNHNCKQSGCGAICTWGEW